MPPSFFSYVPLIVTVTGLILFLWLAHHFLLTRRTDLGAEAKFPRQLILLALSLAGFFTILLMAPMSETTRGQVFGLLGIVITGVIAFSSTTFVANAMAGLMLRVVKSFRPGDFIHVGEFSGRVTERGLFHTEIQTESRDLNTLPNLFLVTNPITVVNSSGTMVSVSISLGYDIPEETIETLLKTAARESALEEPFVLVTGLNDFSVSYKVAGFLTEVTQLLTARSNLHKKVLNVLHSHGIEIVSPNFVNQRRIPENTKIIPAQQIKTTEEKPSSGKSDRVPEVLIFDKAEEASEIENLRSEYATLQKTSEELKEKLKVADENHRLGVETELTALKNKMKKLSLTIETREEKTDLIDS